MDKLPARREFLCTASLAAVSAGLLKSGQASLPSAGLPSDALGGASESPRLFVGCCAYSYSKYLESGKMTMEDFILKGVELGVHGVDITTYWLKLKEPAYLAHLCHFAYKNGMSFSGAAIGTHMCQSDPAKRGEELKKIH